MHAEGFADFREAIQQLAVATRLVRLRLCLGFSVLDAGQHHPHPVLDRGCGLAAGQQSPGLLARIQGRQPGQ